MKYLGAITDDNDIATKKYVDDHAGGDSVSASAVYNAGTKIATVTVNNVAVDIYVPVYAGGVS